MYESGWCVPKGGKHIPEAALVACFFSGETAARLRAQKGIAIPSIRSLADEVASKDTLGLEAIFNREVEYCRQPWGTILEEFSRVEEIAKDAVDEVLIGGKDIHDVFTNAAEKIDKTIHKYAGTAELWEETEPGSEVLSLLQAFLVILAVTCLVMILLVREKERKALISGLSFLSPSLIHLVIFVITPLIFAFYLSFHKWNILLPEKPFVGLGNFREMLTDSQFWNALKNTAIYSLHVPVGMMISLVLAVLLNQKIKGVNFLRTLYFLPSISSFVAIALVWTWIYDPQFGLINFILSIFGIKSLGWLTEPGTALISIMIMSIWMGIGYQMVIFLAGLQGIPDHLYEVAQIDGASRWVQFRRITLPLLTPTTFFVLVTSMIGSFQVFAPIWVMTQGGPMRSTDVVVYHIYQNAWEYLNIGYASAMSWVLFLIIVGITALQFKYIPREVAYE
jgi:ABC-type sugar transport system permease subunit